MFLPSRFCACSFFFLFTSSILVNEAVAMPPKQKKQHQKLPGTEVSPGSNKVDSPLQSSGADSSESYKKQLARALLTKTRGFNWKGFNWTVYYAFFQKHRIKFEDFLKATQHGGWQALTGLANLLVNHGLYEDQDSALFHIFSILNSHNAYLNSDEESGDDLSSNDFYAEGNSLLLTQLATVIQSSTGTVALDNMPFDMLSTLNPQEIVTIMTALQGSLLMQPAVTTVQLNNHLGSLLAVIRGELGITCETPTPQQLSLSPSVIEVLVFFTTKEEKLNVLAFLIGHPFEGDSDPYSDSSSSMQPETTLHAAVASQLYSLWQVSNPNTQAMLAQLAIQVFHFNFLELAQAQQACQAEASPPLLVPITPVMPAYDYGSVQGNSGHNAVLGNLLHITRALQATPGSVAALQTQLAMAQWVDATVQLDAQRAMMLVLNRIKNPQNFKVFMGMLRQITGMQDIIDLIHAKLPSPPLQTVVTHIAPGIASITEYEIEHISGLAAQHNIRGCTELFGAAAVRGNSVAISNYLTTTPGVIDQFVSEMLQAGWITTSASQTLSHRISMGSAGSAAAEILYVISVKLSDATSASKHFKKLINILRRQTGAESLVQHLRDTILELEKNKT